MKFDDLRLIQPLLRAVRNEGYETATPIQAQTIPATLDGRDVLGCAQTGTGKTAAFALPMLQRLADDGGKRDGGRPRGLVLAPTRELAQQIADSFKVYGKHTKVTGTVIYGGVGQAPQVKALRGGVDVVVATPGRLLDLIEQGHCDLSAIEVLVFDEADRMLDMGFMPDIKRIISYLPERKQTLLFSATMPREIRKLASGLLANPVEVTVSPAQPAAERIAQSVYHVDRAHKVKLLHELMEGLSISRAIVFTRTKHGADRLARQLTRGGTEATAIHGDKSQQARTKALDRFRRGDTHVLVATDIAARGIDVDGISHVINFDISRDAESHVHRIGRTARAGAEGAAISLCDREEVTHLRAIEALMGQPIEVVGHEPSYVKEMQERNERVSHPLEGEKGPGRKGRSKRRRQRRRGNGGGAANNASAETSGHGGTQGKGTAKRGGRGKSQAAGEAVQAKRGGPRKKRRRRSRA